MKMNRKEIAAETLKIQQQCRYQVNGTEIDITARQRASEQNSFLLTPEQGHDLIRKIQPLPNSPTAVYRLINQSTVRAIAEMNDSGSIPAVLNFASAKNPGGGFLNGAMAQEEALAAAGGLYQTQLLHSTYYTANRACKSMMYTDHAIYSPEVVFFRDDRFALLEQPVYASVLTLPAVNMGQVIRKGEDVPQAKAVMKDRMRLSLAVFAGQKAARLILGAYGCGVFKNDPAEVACWWRELLEEEGYGRFFEEIVFAVLDRSGSNMAAFEQEFLNKTGV